MYRSKKNYVRAAIFIFAAIIAFSCSEEQKKQLPPPDVKVIEVVQKDITNKVDFVGEVYGFQDISIRARVSGFLDGIHFKEGSHVKKGQLLYSIDPQPFEAEVAAQQSLLAEAKSVYAKAQSDLKRYKPLAETNAVSQADLDGAQLQFEAAEAKVEAAKANLEIAQIKLGYAKIYSPIDGVIGKSLAKVGEVVGQAPLIVLNTVSNMEDIHVEFYLPENQYLKTAQILKTSPELIKESKEEGLLELVLADGSIHDYKGSINFIDRGVNSTTGTILIQTNFKNPDGLIRPGQYAKVRIPVNYNDVIVIPQKCVKELQGQYSVFTVNAENQIETRQIEAGIKVGDMWIVNKGLNAGEKVLIEGLQKVRNGVTVSPEVVEFKSQFESL
jgi:membrane fusion protein (multidrug efflux system)